MTDKAELQRISRLVDVNRQRLEQVEQQINQLETVKSEHRETEASLGALNDSTDSMIPLGSGVHLPVSEQGNVVVDIGSNIFAERKLSNKLKKELQKSTTEFTPEKREFYKDIIKKLYIKWKPLFDESINEAESEISKSN